MDFKKSKILKKREDKVNPTLAFFVILLTSTIVFLFFYLIILGPFVSKLFTGGYEPGKAVFEIAFSSPQEDEKIAILEGKATLDIEVVVESNR
ncbi:unnamed protein product, partial [marine sediment metagenome]